MGWGNGKNGMKIQLNMKRKTKKQKKNIRNGDMWRESAAAGSLDAG